jgi:hypothetical protein
MANVMWNFRMMIRICRSLRKMIRGEMIGSMIILLFVLSRRDLTSFLKRQQRFSEYVDPDEGNGELTITIPASLQPQEQNSVTTNDDNNTNDIVYKVTIDFSLEQPENGIHFFIPDDDAKLSRVSEKKKTSIYQQKDALVLA